jgi:phosphoribosyl 1,2-cyclic phosphate phosphodiesterase
MELIFLGSGAAEGVPAAYCRCTVCEGVRQRGGVEIKTRSSLRVGPHHQIDISPDHYWQMIRAGTDMHDVEHLLVTHTHEDHFTLNALRDKEMSRVVNGKPIALYMSEPARVYVEGVIAHLSLSAEEMRWIEANLSFHGLEYFQEYAIGGFSVGTVKGNHTAHGASEYSINYLVTMPHGKTLLYGCDTGFYKEETWAYLAGKHVDTLILECTFAGRQGGEEFPDGHLDMPAYLKVLERMAGIGFVDASTAVYATHFNPHQGLDHFAIHDRLQRSPFRGTAAYDGLRIEA